MSRVRDVPILGVARRGHYWKTHTNPPRGIAMAIDSRLILSVVTGILFSGCAPLVTQSPGQGLSPVNAVSEGEDKHLILKGHDVVAYFTDKADRPGSPAIKSVYKGVTFRFASPEHKALFDQAPEKYIPQFGGYCTNGIAYAIPWGGDTDIWEIFDGKLYMFGGRGSHDAFMRDAQHGAREQILERGSERCQRARAAHEAPRLPRAALQDREGARGGSGGGDGEGKISRYSIPITRGRYSVSSGQ